MSTDLLKQAAQTFDDIFPTDGSPAATDVLDLPPYTRNQEPLSAEEKAQADEMRKQREALELDYLARKQAGEELTVEQAYDEIFEAVSGG